MKKKVYPLLLLFPFLCAFAGEVTIVDAGAALTDNGVYRFDVTLRHADSGWEHYADGWVVVAPDGRILGERTLYHPHVNEQPFTRSLSGIAIPEDVNHVEVRAHDKLHGYSSKPFRINLQ